jgi:hypothetical protein
MLFCMSSCHFLTDFWIISLIDEVKFYFSKSNSRILKPPLPTYLPPCLRMSNVSPSEIVLDKSDAGDLIHCKISKCLKSFKTPLQHTRHLKSVHKIKFYPKTKSQKKAAKSMENARYWQENKDTIQSRRKIRQNPLHLSKPMNWETAAAIGDYNGTEIEYLGIIFCSSFRTDDLYGLRFRNWI